MKYPIEYTAKAKADLLEAVSWWSEHRSSREANRWLTEIQKTINMLSTDSERFPFAAETKLCPTGLRQLNFGIGRRYTHRVVFTISENCIKIVRIRHVARGKLIEEDLE